MDNYRGKRNGIGMRKRVKRVFNGETRCAASGSGRTCWQIGLNLAVEGLAGRNAKSGMRY